MILSYTFLNTWTICPHQCARRYIIKDIAFEKTKEMIWGEEVHWAIEGRITGKKPLPENMKQWEPLMIPLDDRPVKVEMSLGITSDGHSCDFFARNVWLRGTLDCVIMNNNTALILDWKTGKPREDPFELDIHAMLLKARYPKIKNIVGKYVWLRDCNLGTLHDCSDTQRTLNSINKIANEIDFNGEQRDIDVSEYKKTPGPLCGWCPVTDCEHWNRKWRGKNENSRSQGKRQTERIS